MERRKAPFPQRIALVVGVVAVAALLISLVDFSPDLGHLDALMLTGPEKGNYQTLGARLSERAEVRGGKLAQRSSHGTVDNLEQLTAAKKDCSAQFALVQDGIAPAADADLELIARLTRSESMFLLGKDAARLTRFRQLKGLKIGVGPAKSGTDQLAREVFGAADLAPLELTLSNHSYDEQLTKLQAGELDLGAFVLDEDAALVRAAVRDRNLELTSFKHLDVIARRYPYLWHGRIGAGQYDPIKLLPPSDKRVLRVDTLVVGNGCASHAETVALLSLLSDHLPGLIQHNRKRGGSDLYASASASKSFFQNEGPELVEEHIPWLVDLLPPSNWVYIVMTLSVAFNIMGFGHRFRLWRIDVNRVAADERVREVLGQRLTSEEIHDLEPRPSHLKPKAVRAVDDALADLTALRGRCRRQSGSMLVPMGQEMAYRYQEDQIEEQITALRLFRSRVKEAQEA